MALDLVELALADAADEGFPLTGSEDQQRTVAIHLSVAHGHSTIRCEADLDTVVATARQARLAPARESVVTEHDVHPFWISQRPDRPMELNSPAKGDSTEIQYADATLRR